MVKDYTMTKNLAFEHSNLNDELYNEMVENGYVNLDASWQDEGIGVTEAWGVTQDDVNWVGTVSGSANGIDLCWTQADYPCPDDPICKYVLTNCDKGLYDIDVYVEGVIVSLSWDRIKYVTNGDAGKASVLYECKATVNWTVQDSRMDMSTSS